MNHVSFVDKIVKTGSTPIHLIRCRDSDGRDCYFFIMASAAKIDLLIEASHKKDTMDLTQYGHVVASGFGKDPSPEVKYKLKEEYNFDADAIA